MAFKFRYEIMENNRCIFDRRENAKLEIKIVWTISACYTRHCWFSRNILVKRRNLCFFPASNTFAVRVLP